MYFLNANHKLLQVASLFNLQRMTLIDHICERLKLFIGLKNGLPLISCYSMCSVGRFSPHQCLDCKNLSLSHYLDQPCEAFFEYCFLNSIQFRHFEILRLAWLQENSIFGPGGQFLLFVKLFFYNCHSNIFSKEPISSRRGWSNHKFLAAQSVASH